MTSMLMLLCACWFGLVAASPTTPYALEQSELHFERFIQDFDIQYPNKHEKQVRFTIFKENLEEINRLNEISKNTVFGISQFSDITSEEFRNIYSCFNTHNRSAPYLRAFICSTLTDADINYNDAPESFDWREHQAVTPVKDQKHCGSCYAFSSTGNIEGQYAIKHNQLLELSEQQIVDCDRLDGGCGGGNMETVFEYLIENGGIELEASYLYTGHVGHCVFDKSKVAVKLSNCDVYDLTSQEKVKQLLYHNGPLAIGVRGEGIKSYKSGVISDKQCAQGNLNHAVLLVGYGTEKGEPYWLVKNSWGQTWGDQGYFKMQRGESALSCGLLDPNNLMVSSVVE